MGAGILVERGELLLHHFKLLFTAHKEKDPCQPARASTLKQARAAAAQLQEVASLMPKGVLQDQHDEDYEVEWTDMMNWNHQQSPTVLMLPLPLEVPQVELQTTMSQNEPGSHAFLGAA